MDLAEILKEKIEEIEIQDIVRNEIKSLISNDVRNAIRDSVRKEVDEIIHEEIKTVLKKPIQTDDGWGKKVSYPSFEELFKAEFAIRMENNWDMKKAIDSAVKERVSLIMNQNMEEIIKKFVDMVTGTVLKSGTKV